MQAEFTGEGRVGRARDADGQATGLEYAQGLGLRPARQGPHRHGSGSPAARIPASPPYFSTTKALMVVV